MPSEQHGEGAYQRLREWYRDLRQPKHVEKASKAERRKRTLWEIGSIILSFLIVVIPVIVVDWLSLWNPPTGLAGLAAAIWVLVSVFAVEFFVVFPWGVERFDIVTPWQFRDAEAEKDD